MVVTRGWGEGGMRGLLCRVSVGDDEKVLERNSGDGCTKM